MQVNLLPVQHRPKPSLRMWPILVTIALMLNLILISTYWLTLLLEYGNVQNSLNSLRTQVANLQREIDASEWKSQLAVEVAEKADFIAGAEADSILWHPLFKAVERAMVPGIKLKSITCAGDGTVTINGETDTIRSVAKFLGSLQVETELEIVQFNRASPDPQGNFSIVMRDWYGREVHDDE